MVRALAILFGIFFIFIGVAGLFLPSLYVNNLLFGYLMLNFLHNIIHLVSGVLAIMAATSYHYSRLYFQVFGVIYGILAILGFVFEGNLSFIMLHMNLADNILHLVIAIVSLYIGFYSQKRLA